MIRKFRQEDFESVCAIAERAWEPIFSGFERQLGKEVYAVLNPDSRNSKEKQLAAHLKHSPVAKTERGRGNKVFDGKAAYG